MAGAYLGPRLPPSLSFKPGPLHRLDKPTSGVIVFSAALEGARIFSALLREGRLKKYYLALVEGRLRGPEFWEDPLAREGERPRIARTRVRPLAELGGRTLILAELLTGRTHQIRAQAAARGHPLEGDLRYGGSPGNGGPWLHAWKLELGEGARLFPGPVPPLISAPPPEAFLRRLGPPGLEALREGP
jgi:23S rRNA pseudouridine955/2504/2580 synthase